MAISNRTTNISSKYNIRYILYIINQYQKTFEDTPQKLVCQVSNDHIGVYPKLVTMDYQDKVALECLECDNIIFPGLTFVRFLEERLATNPAFANDLRL